METLKTNYKDDILDTSVNTQRKYRMVNNADGTISLEDVSVYTQNGDSFGAADINKTNQAVLDLNSSLTQLATYSMNDVAVGKWIDGKTLYRKVITTTTEINKQNASIQHNIQNADLVFFENVFFIRNSNNYVCHIPYISDLRTSITVDRINIHVITNDTWGNSYTKVFVLLYTKQ